MKKSMYLVLTLTFLISSSLCAAVSDAWTTSEYLPGRMIVRFDESIGNRVPAVKEKGVVELGLPEIDVLFEEFEVTGVRRLVPDGILDRLKAVSDVYRSYVLEFRGEYPVLDVVERFHGNRYVVFAEPDLLRRALRSPNDPLWNSQWDKRLVGADFVWDVSTGSADIICAGIDTGVDYDHNDLRPILWVNPGEDLDEDGSTGDWDDYPGDTDDLNGVDDDDNGYEDDFLGWDFIRNIGNCATFEDCDNITDNDMLGVNSHGTHVGGIMVADGDNGIGMSGYTWSGRLMALRAGYEDDEGQGYMPQSATVPAIYYAVANGARVLNMSYGGPGTSSEAAEAMTAAWGNGAILFAASGNDGSSSSNNYPANYPEVIAVNATNNQDRLAGFSNRGDWTDLCAPGVTVLGTVIGSGYQNWDGTSMASPSAAGVAALVWSLMPSMTNGDLRELLESTAVDISGLNPSVPPSHLGNGRVSASGAVASFYPRLVINQFTVDDSENGDGDGRVEFGETGELSFTIRNEPNWAVAEDISITVTSESGNIQLDNSSFAVGTINPGQTVNSVEHPVALTLVPNFYPAAWVTVTVTFSSPSGYSSSVDINLRVGRGQVLIVDDDAGGDYQSYYETAFEDLGYAPDLWSSALDGTVSAAEMGDYSGVIWVCGNAEASTLTAEDRTELAAFLDAGGRLILVGQGIDEDISDEAFYGDYLHAETDNHQDGDRFLDGIGGNPISDGDVLLLQGGSCGGNGLLGPSRILPVNGAEALYTYQPGGVAAVTYAGDYKVVYFAFALEAACGLAGSVYYADVLSATLDWMEILDAPESPDTDLLPSAVMLHGNYPNPFNPSTTIRFDLSAQMRVSLHVFDLLGREVTQLIDAPLAGGRHEVRFDGSGYASGVYLVRLQAGDQVRTSKMMLLK